MRPPYLRFESGPWRLPSRRVLAIIGAALMMGSGVVAITSIQESTVAPRATVSASPASMTRGPAPPTSNAAQAGASGLQMGLNGQVNLNLEVDQMSFDTYNGTIYASGGSNSLAQFYPSNNTALPNVTIPSVSTPYFDGRYGVTGSIAYDPADASIYVTTAADNPDNYIAIIGPGGMSVQVLSGSSITTPDQGTAYDPNTMTMWSSNILSCVVYQLQDRTMLGNISNSQLNDNCANPYENPDGLLLFDPANGEMLVTTVNGTILQFDGATGKVVGAVATTAPAGQTVSAMVYDPSDQEVYLAMEYISTGSGSGLAVFDAHTLSYVTTLTSTDPTLLAYDSEYGDLIGANCGTGVTACLIDPSTGSLVASFDDHSTFWGTAPLYDPETDEIYVGLTDNGVYQATSGTVDDLCVGTSLNTVTFTESGLAKGTDWSLDFNGYDQSSNTTTDSFTVCHNGTYAWAVPQLYGYEVSPLAGNTTVEGMNVSVTLKFTAFKDIVPRVLYEGAYLSGVPLENVYGVYAAFGSAAATSVTGKLGGETYTFTQQITGTQTPWNLSLDPATLGSSGVFTITVTFPTATVKVKENVTVLTLPSWLQSIVTAAGAPLPQIRGIAEWGDFFAYDLATLLPISALFGAQLSVPILGDENYSWLPDFNLTFSFNSATASASLNADFSYSTDASPLATFDLAGKEDPVNASATIDLSMTGQVEVNVTSSTIVWTKSWANLTFGVDFSFTIPIEGFQVNVQGATVDLGLVLDFDVQPSYEIALTFTPTSSGNGSFPMLSVQVTSGLGTLDIPVTITLKAGTDAVLSLEAGAELDFSFKLRASSPYIASAQVTGSVFVGFCVLGYCIKDSWNVFSQSLSPASVLRALTQGAENSTVTTLPRYYNSTNYEELAWVNGAYNGTAVDNVFPDAILSAAVAGGDGYLAWEYDNVSMPESKSGALTGFSLAPGTTTLSSFKLPKPSGANAWNPTLGSYGTGIVAFWDSAGYGKFNGSTMVNSTAIGLDEATYTPSSGKWSATTKWLAWGDPESTAVASLPGDTRALVLDTPAMLATTGSLLEYDVENDTLLWNESVAGVVGISSFDAVSNVAILALLSGGVELWNVTTDSVISAAPQSTMTLQTASFGIANTVGLWYQGGSTSEYLVYNLTTGWATVPLSLGESATQATLVAYNGHNFLATVSSGQLSVLENTGLNSWISVGSSYAVGNPTGLTTSVAGKFLLAYTLQPYGNASQIQLNLGLAVVPLVVPPAPAVTASVIGPDDVRIAWSLPTAGAYAVDQYVVLAGTTAKPTHVVQSFPSGVSSTNITDLDPADTPVAFAVEARNSVGNGTKSPAAFLYPVEFDAVSSLGGNWTADLGEYSQSTNQSTLLFLEGNGTYNYSITPPSNRSVGLVSGQIVVAGQGMFQAEKMAATTAKFYAVTFTESGLPSGSYWQVQLGAMTESSVGDSLAIYVPNGDYTYHISAPGYSPSPANGSASVSGAKVSVAVAFVESDPAVCTCRTGSPGRYLANDIWIDRSASGPWDTAPLLARWAAPPVPPRRSTPGRDPSGPGPAMDQGSSSPQAPL